MGRTTAIVSPLRYEPGSDTVRIVGTNHCVAAFTGGTFAGARIFTEDRGGATAWPFLDRALHTGFHERNRKLAGTPIASVTWRGWPECCGFTNQRLL